MKRWGARLAALALPVLIGAQETGYVASVENWRRQHDAAVRRADGPLAWLARWTVPAGTGTIGSAPDSTYRLPPESSPARLGMVERTALAARLRLADGEEVRVDTTLPLQSARAEAGSTRLILSVNKGEVRLSVYDPNSRQARETPLAWYGIDERYRVTAAWETYDPPRTMDVPDNNGAVRTWPVPGKAVFTLQGKALTLEPIRTGAMLTFLFRDETSGAETYGGGRYVVTEPPKDGRLTLDFNKAYHPYCALNPLVVCPVPPKQNRVPVAVRAGERLVPGGRDGVPKPRVP